MSELFDVNHPEWWAVSEQIDGVWTDIAPPPQWDIATKALHILTGARIYYVGPPAHVGDTVTFGVTVAQAPTYGDAFNVSELAGSYASAVADPAITTLQKVAITLTADVPTPGEYAGPVIAVANAANYSCDVTAAPYATPPDPPAPDPHNCACDDGNANRTLGELRADLMRRLGFGAQVGNPPPGMADLLNSFLIEAQELLYRRYDVLRTERFFSWDLQQGVRFYDVDANVEVCTKRLDPRKITWVGLERDGIWYPLTCGIPPELYSHDQWSGWPQRYEIRSCIEVWPVPDATPAKLYVKGRFEIEPFAADTDKTTIDDRAVFLLALANAKAHYQRPDAGNYVQELESYMQTLVAGAHQTRRYIPGHDVRFDPVYIQPKPVTPWP